MPGALPGLQKPPGVYIDDIDQAADCECVEVNRQDDKLLARRSNISTSGPSS